MEAPSLVIVSGLSGAGRTTVMKALEDLGFYCVDNLPVVLLERFLDLFSDGASRLAVVIDVRERRFLAEFPETYDRLRAGGVAMELIFLEASDESLERRFDESRRVHPAGVEGGVNSGIAHERELLAPLASRAELVLDTSQMTVHDLKRYVTRRYEGASRGAPLQLELISFGFRFGVPESADLMIDVRFLPNPNFEEDLRERTGLDPEVSAYVVASQPGEDFLKRFHDFIEFLLPLYEAEGKAYLTIAVGCTGGQHRSVAIVAGLERYLQERRIEVRATHRDMGRDRRDRK